MAILAADNQSEISSQIRQQQVRRKIIRRLQDCRGPLEGTNGIEDLDGDISWIFFFRSPTKQLRPGPSTFWLFELKTLCRDSRRNILTRPTPPTAHTLIEVALWEILRALESFYNGSDGGPNGLRLQHLKNVLGKLKNDLANHGKRTGIYIWLLRAIPEDIS